MYDKQRNRMRRNKIQKNCFIYLKESKEEEKKNLEKYQTKSQFVAK